MAQAAQRYRLRLSRLDFVSLVDDPAQPNAKTLLIKRKGAAVEGETHAKFVKSNDELGVAFFWAFTSTNPDGTPHYDFHGDAIEKDNLVKIAMDFMTDGGGAVDEMHDGKSTDARAVAFPMDPEIAKAFGVETKTSGLMVMIKLNEAQLSKLKDGTYTGVSIAGMGTREAVKGLRKQAAIGHTDEVDGHQHSIHTDGADLFTSHNTAAGSEYGHAHTVIRGADGALTVLADSGHTHAITDDESTQTPTVAAAASGESPRAPIAASMNPQPEMTTMTLDEALAEIADLKAKLADLDKSKEDLAGLKDEAEKMADLDDTEKALYRTLDAKDAKAFLNKSKSERKAAVEVAKAADPVAYTCDDGTEIRKSQGDLMVKLAKRADEATKAANIEKAAREATELRKRATDLMGTLAGTVEQHADILKAVEATGKPETLASLTAIVNMATDAMKAASIAKGAGGTVMDVSKAAKIATFTAKLAEFAKAAGKTPAAAQLDFVRTAEGAELYSAANA